MQRTKRQVARFRDAERSLDRLEVAHFADEHHVGILAQHRPERAGEAPRVAVNLALVDDAALVRMDVLDRIFDREDVPLAFGC